MTDLLLPFPCFGCSADVSNIEGPTKDYYSNSTQLLKAIEKQDWNLAIHILNMNSAEAAEWVSYQGIGGIGSFQRLPIHEACMRQPTEAVIDALIKSNPKGVREKDSDGQLPLHHACANGASLAIVKLLLLSCPDSIDVRNNWGNFPIDIAKLTSCDQAIIDALKKRPSYYAVYELNQQMSTLQEENEKLRQENQAYKQKADQIMEIFEKPSLD